MNSFSKKYNNECVLRQDRLLEANDAMELLKNGEYAVLSMVESRNGDVAAYGIPISYVWNSGDYIYIHCGPKGHKLACLDANALVSLTVVGRTQVVSNQFTTIYSSIVVRGSIERKLDAEERMNALGLIVDKYSPEFKEIGMKYAAKSFHRTEILRLKIDTISGKAKNVKL